MKIGVVGLWHLGCVISASWSKIENNVIAFDYDSNNIERLKNGETPLFEPYLSETIKTNLLKKTLKFTNNISELNDCEFIFISYDTPVDDNDDSDTTILTKSIEDLSEILKNETIVIVSSQTPVGFCKELRTTLKKHNSNLDLAYSPENLRLGEAIKCYLEPDRIILGSSDNVTKDKCIELFYKITFTTSPILSMNLESAEMVKHGINSFLATSIVFANHLSDICSNTGANIKDVIKGIKSDPRIGEKSYLSPGIGFSGGTLGRDLKVLKNANTKYSKIFESIYNFNSERKYSIVSKIENIIGNLNNKKLGLLGLTYKPNTSTLRRSIPIDIANLLVEKKSIVNVFDPKADYSELVFEPKFNIKKNIEDIINNSDLIIILTEWKEFIDYDWNNIEKKIIIFDTKNCLNLNSNEKIIYHSL